MLSRALYGVSSVPFAEAAPYLLQLLQHPRKDGACALNHHNKVAIWVCVEMLALHEVTKVIARASKKQFLHQWWTLLQNLEWSVDTPKNDEETEDDDDAPIARSRKKDEVKAEEGVAAPDAPPTNDAPSTEDAPPTDDVLLYILLDEVCTLVPENAKIKAKMAAAFGESFKCELTDAIQIWVFAVLIIQMAQYLRLDGQRGRRAQGCFEQGRVQARHAVPRGAQARGQRQCVRIPSLLL